MPVLWPAPMLPNTADVRNFQRTHTDHRGRPLRVDGVRGGLTRWAEAIASLHPVRQAVVGRAISQIGRTETPPGSNSSASIDAWLKRCGVPPGQPWCAAFASWCLGDVACAGAVRLGQMYVETRTPVPGDLMFYATDTQGHGHIGIVTGVDHDTVMTVEGNVDSAVGVWRRSREAVRFSRPFLDASGDVAGIPGDVPLRVANAVGTR